LARPTGHFSNLKLRSLPFEPARLPFFYGWVVLGAGTLGMLMSTPGQTVGVSVFTDPLMQALGLNRSLLSLGYLVGTLMSAILLSRAGRLYDRHGARIVATAAAILLALTLLLLSYSARITDGLATILTSVSRSVIAFGVVSIGFFLLRFSGQGVLTLSSRNMVMEWFQRRRGMANAAMGVSISFGFSYAPRVFGALVDANGWESAWRWIGAGVTVFAFVAFILYRDKPEAHGLKPDGGHIPASRPEHPEIVAGKSFTVAEARRTYAFWCFALALALSSIVVTAYTFHIVSIFGDAGLSRSRAVGIFFPASLIAVSVQFAGSWLSDRIKLKYLCAFQMAGIVTLCFGLLSLSSGWPIPVVIVGHGITQGMFGIISNLAWPRFYGRRHLGAVSGFASALAVGGSAIGPYFFSFGRDLSGGYLIPTLLCGVLAAALFVASFWANRPAHPQTDPARGEKDLSARP
jgi:MFS transporter, OFA family, oxalate/formate antiporter